MAMIWWIFRPTLSTTLYAAIVFLTGDIVRRSCRVPCLGNAVNTPLKSEKPITDGDGLLQVNPFQAVQYNSSGSLRNLHLAMVGDSLTRYQYLSLAYFVHNHRWVETGDKPNILGTPRQWKSWEECNSYTNAVLGGREQENCDCHRPPGKINLQTSYNNRYFKDEEQNTYLTLITKTGRPEAHGHWNASSVYEDHTGEISTHKNFRWRYNWTEVIREHLAHIRPQPRYVVLNAGIWKDNDLTTESIFQEIRQALDQAGMIGIYKTTTRRSWENYTRSEPHDVLGCRMLHACLNLSWTGTLGYRGNYWDPVHFLAHVNTQFNTQLLDLIAGLEQQHHQQQQRNEATSQ